MPAYIYENSKCWRRRSPPVHRDEVFGRFVGYGDAQRQPHFTLTRVRTEKERQRRAPVMIEIMAEY